MRTLIDKVTTSLNKAIAFNAKYGTALEKSGFLLIIEGPTLIGDKEDAALFGKVFGKEGWTRKLEYNKTFRWFKTVDEVEIRLDAVETLDIDNTPVAPQDFPIQLETV